MEELLVLTVRGIERQIVKYIESCVAQGQFATKAGACRQLSEWGVSSAHVLAAIDRLIDEQRPPALAEIYRPVTQWATTATRYSA